MHLGVGLFEGHVRQVFVGRQDTGAFDHARRQIHAEG